MATIGLVGFGSFGRFISPYLSAHFDVTAYDTIDRGDRATMLGVSFTEKIEEVCSKDIVILCIPVQYLESFLKEASHHFKPNTLVVDVSSVKLKPLALMRQYLPKGVEFMGTHPLFGPQSGKEGINDLRIVLCPGDLDIQRQKCITQFLEEKLKLNVLLRSAERHDEKMAYVQGLSHFISRIITAIEIPETEMKTKAYQELLTMKYMLGSDSYDLFLTIENENPFAKEVRDKFVDAAKKLNDKIS